MGVWNEQSQAKATAKAPELCAGQSNSTKVQELCIAGQSNSTKVQELCIVGQSNSTKAQELCVVGQSNSTKTPDLCTDVQQNHAIKRRNGYFLDKNSHRRCKNYIFFDNFPIGACNYANKEELLNV